MAELFGCLSLLQNRESAHSFLGNSLNSRRRVREKLQKRETAHS